MKTLGPAPNPENPPKALADIVVHVEDDDTYEANLYILEVLDVDAHGAEGGLALYDVTGLEADREEELRINLDLDLADLIKDDGTATDNHAVEAAAMTALRQRGWHPEEIVFTYS